MEVRESRRFIVDERPMKECSTCKRILPLLAYTKNAQTRDGFNYHCITCQKVKSAERRHNYVRNAGRY